LYSSIYHFLGFGDAGAGFGDAGAGLGFALSKQPLVLFPPVFTGLVGFSPI
jgi:hypothetical protein